MKKSAVAAMVLIVIMFGSSLTIGLIQALNFGFTGRPAEKLELPTSSIIDYELSLEAKAALLQRGLTIVRFSYGLPCEQCLQIKNVLEALTEREQGQLLLIELVSNSTVPDLVVSSSYGEENVYNITGENIARSICKLMVQPPLECAKFSLG